MVKMLPNTLIFKAGSKKGIPAICSDARLAFHTLLI